VRAHELRAHQAGRRAIAAVWDFAARVCPLVFPPGVHKYRTIEDANADRERWAQANFEAFQARRRGERGASGS